MEFWIKIKPRLEMIIIMTRIIVITWHLPVSPCYPPWQQQKHRGASPFSHWKKNISQKVGTLQPPVQRNWSWCDFSFSQVIKSNIFNIFFILRDATVITHFTIARITCSSIACFSLSRVITWQPTKFGWIIFPTSDLNFLIVKYVCFVVLQNLHLEVGSTKAHLKKTFVSSWF